MHQLYDQVQLTKGCTIGTTAQKSFTLEGLRQGVYYKVLGPWVKKILIGQGRIKLETASMADLQHGATDLLATSTYFKGNVLLPGKLPRPTAPNARAATNSETPAAPSGNRPSSDAEVEFIVKQFRNGFPLNHTSTA
jgi:hypothetical protein